MGTRILLFVMVVALAFTGSLFGGLGEEIQIACSISLAQMGLLMSLSQVGSFVSFLTLPLLARKLNAYSLLIIGILASSATLLGMGLSRSALIFGLFFLLNALGGYLYGTSNIMVLINVDRVHMKTNIPLMHLTFSIASIFSGYYIAFLKQHTWYHGYLQMSLVYLVMGALFILVKPDGIEGWEQRKNQKLSDSFSLLKHRAFVKYLLFLILANAVEYCNVVYPLLAVTQLHGAGAKEVGLAIITLHSGSTLSRLAAIPLLKKGFSPHRILLALCLVGMLGLSGFFLAPNLGWAYLSLALMGLGMGSEPGKPGARDYLLAFRPVATGQYPVHGVHHREDWNASSDGSCHQHCFTFGLVPSPGLELRRCSPVFACIKGGADSLLG